MSPRRRGTTVLLATAAMLLAACGGPDREPDTRDLSEGTSELTVEEMGRLGARIWADPERAEELVAELGLTAREFEERVRSITDDPDRSVTYARAFEEEVEELGRETDGDGGGTASDG